MADGPMQKAAPSVAKTVDPTVAPAKNSDLSKALTDARNQRALDMGKAPKQSWTPYTYEKHPRPDEPHGQFNFRIEIEGIDCGGFKSVDGLSAEIEEIEHQTGMDPYPLKRPGRKKFGNIKLGKGYFSNVSVWKWFEDALKGKVSRKSGSIVLLADDGVTELIRYNFFNAWPKSWNGFKLDGKGADISVEEVELVIEYMEVKTK